MSATTVLDDAHAYLDQDRAIVAVMPWGGSLVTIASSIRCDQLAAHEAALATHPDPHLRATFLVAGIECLRRMLDDTFGTA